MNKQNYQKEYSDLKNQIEHLKEKQRSLTNEYIKKNSRFKIGDRVKVKSEYGYVVSLGIDYKDDIKPKMMKEKKDGNQGMHSLHCYRYEEIELAPKE